MLTRERAINKPSSSTTTNATAQTQSHKDNMCFQYIIHYSDCMHDDTSNHTPCENAPNCEGEVTRIINMERFCSNCFNAKTLPVDAPHQDTTYNISMLGWLHSFVIFTLASSSRIVDLPSGGKASIFHPDVRNLFLERLSHAKPQFVYQLEHNLHGGFMAGLKWLERDSDFMRDRTKFYLLVRDAALAHKMRDFGRSEDPNQIAPEPAVTPDDFKQAMNNMLRNGGDVLTAAADLILLLESPAAEEIDGSESESFRESESFKELMRRLNLISTPASTPLDDENCSICRESYNHPSEGPPQRPVQLPCSHIFGLSCLGFVLSCWDPCSGLPRCPLCRAPINLMSPREIIFGLNGSYKQPEQAAGWFVWFTETAGDELLDRDGAALA